MHLHSCNPTFHNRTQKNFAQNSIGQHTVGTPLQLYFGQVSVIPGALFCTMLQQNVARDWGILVCMAYS